MPYSVQIVVDCANPHDLAAWWADTLDWQVEAQDEAFIRQMLAEGRANESDTEEWHGALVWRAGAAIVSGADAALMAPRILFQRVPEAKLGKNRLHLDLRTAGDDPEQVRARLVERGAVVLHAGSQGPFSWVTMTDPEGNEFCV